MTSSRFVSLCTASVSLLAHRAPAACEVLNDVDGSLVLLARYWRRHRDALLAEISSASADGPFPEDSELGRVLAYYFAEVQDFPGETPKAKLEALFGRIKRAYIEKHSPLELLRFFDSPDTLFYVDCERGSAELVFLELALSRAQGRAVFADQNSIQFKNETRFPLSRRQVEAA